MNTASPAGAVIFIRRERWSTVARSSPGTALGTIAYMSPEQALGQDEVDGRTDLFSLGVVLYEWITGFKLFTGDSEVAILKSITEGKIYAPSYFKSDIPAPVEAILMRALEKDRSKRYQTAWEMQYDIDQFLSQYEFTPSNIHLANFLKQLFNDELLAEKEKLMAPPVSGASRVPSEEPMAQEPIPLHAGRERMGSGAQQIVNVALQQDELDELFSVAQRNDLTVDELVREIVKGWLKYR